MLDRPCYPVQAGAQSICYSFALVMAPFCILDVQHRCHVLLGALCFYKAHGEAEVTTS